MFSIIYSRVRFILPRNSTASTSNCAQLKNFTSPCKKKKMCPLIVPQQELVGYQSSTVFSCGQRFDEFLQSKLSFFSPCSYDFFLCLCCSYTLTTCSVMLFMIHGVVLVMSCYFSYSGIFLLFIFLHNGLEASQWQTCHL